MKKILFIVSSIVFVNQLFAAILISGKNNTGIPFKVEYFHHGSNVRASALVNPSANYAIRVDTVPSLGHREEIRLFSIGDVLVSTTQIQNRNYELNNIIFDINPKSNDNSENSIEPTYKLANTPICSSNLQVGVNLSGCHRENTHINFPNKVKLNHAVLRNVYLNGSTMFSSDLKYANLTDANLNKIKLAGSDLENANLTNAKLFDANLVEVNLERATLTGANLSKASLARANLRGIRSNQDLGIINLSEAILQDANLELANFTKANLYKADLSHAKLNMANFSNANLMVANLIGADLRFTNFRGADLRGADLRGAKMDLIRLDKDTKLTGAIWKNGKVCGAGSFGECK